MLVSLVDTQHDEDVHINDWMVQQGLAEYGSMVRSRPSNFVFRHYISRTNYHYNRYQKSQEKFKFSRQTNPPVDYPESQNSTGSKDKLKSVNDLKSLMSKYSKYQKESNHLVSPESKTTDSQTGAIRARFIEKLAKVFVEEKRDSASNHTNEDFVEGEVSSGRLEDSGTFRSFFGGHGHMNLIDWSKLRNDVRLQENPASPNVKAESQTIDKPPSINSCQENEKNSESRRHAQRCSDERSKESPYMKNILDTREVIEPSVMKSLTNRISPAKNCFSNAVKCNKDNYYSVHGKKMWWSPEGNIQHKTGVITPLLRLRKKNIKNKESEIDSMKVYASPEILQILDNESSQSLESDQELDFLINLKKKADRHNTETLDLNQKKNIENKLPSNTGQSDSALVQNTTGDREKSSSLSNHRFAKILNYMNRKKQTPITSISDENSSAVHSSTSIDTESVEAPDTTSSDLNVSESSLASSKILEKKTPEQTSNPTQSISFSDTHDTSRSNNNFQSETFNALVDQHKLITNESLTAFQNLDKLAEKAHPISRNEQSRVPFLNQTPIQCTKNDEQFSELADLSNEIVTVLNQQSDNISELDSDDLSYSHSASEAEITKIASSKKIVHSIDNIEPKLLEVAKALIIPQDSSSDENKDSRENLTSSNESMHSINDGQIETRVSEIVTSNIVPVFNDLESMSDSDEWDVNGEWVDFMEGKFVDNLETASIPSKLAIRDQDNDHSELDDVLNTTDFDNEKRNEKVYDGKYREICDTIDSERSELDDSLSQDACDIKVKNTMGSTDCEELPDSSTTSENCQKENQSDKIKKEVLLVNSAINKNLSTSNENTLSNASASSEKKSANTLMSKTKSMHDMLENFKLKVSLKNKNNELKKAESCLESNKSSSISAGLQFKQNLKSGTTSSTDSGKSRDSSAKELSLPESEIFADLSDTSNSSRCSLNVISSDMVDSANNSEIAGYITAHKYNPYLQSQNIVLIKSTKSSSNDSVEFVEEEPNTPSKQHSMTILSRIKMQQLSIKSPGTPSETNASVVSETDHLLLNESSTSSNSSSRWLLDKIKNIF